MKVIYIWLLPDQLFLPPSYQAAHFDIRTRRDRIEQLVGHADGALPISQDVRISRLITDNAKTYVYQPHSASDGVYVFVLEGEVRTSGKRYWGDATAQACGISTRSNVR
jgi:quercetin 2,3-dioxygenase